MKSRETILERFPAVDDVVTVHTRAGKTVTGRLLQTYNGTRDGHVRGVVSNQDCDGGVAAGFIGVYKDKS